MIVLLGQHPDRTPELDVYAQLYRLAGSSRPDSERTKPPCCDASGQPPDWTETCEDIVDHARKIARH